MPRVEAAPTLQSNLKCAAPSSEGTYAHKDAEQEEEEENEQVLEVAFDAAKM